MSAPNTYSLPDAPQVKSLLGMLFDGLSVKLGGKVDLSPKSLSYCAVFVGRDGAPAALCACDLAFAANSGAALSMLPPNAAKEAVRSKELTPVMIANLHEVMNICTRLLLKDETPHVRLDQLCPVTELPTAATAFMGAAKNRIDFEMGFEKYGPGAFTVISG